MPIFEIDTGGKLFQVEAPDAQTAVAALGNIPAEPSNSLAGSGKAALSGLGGGLISLAGLPADAADLASRGYDKLTGKNTNETVGPAVKPYGSENIKRKVEEVTGPFYKPQTTAEKYLSTVSGFLPAAIGGPAGIGTRVLTRAVIPGVASEAAGQLTEGTALEPVARVAGALGGAVGGSKLASAINAPKAAPVPSMAALESNISAGYKNPAVTSLEISPAYAENVANQIKTNLQQARLSEKQAGKVYDLVEGLKKPEFGANHRIADFDATRRVLNKLYSGEEGAAAKIAIRGIDAATLRIPQAAVVSGDARAASQALFAARKDAAAKFRAERVQAVLEDAANTARATHSGGNLENEIYKRVRTMLKPGSKELRGWTEAEKDMLRAVLPGASARLVRRVGKLFGGGGGLGQLAAQGAGGAMFGWPGIVALPAVGMAANKAGSALATGRLNKVEESLRARSASYGPANYAQRQSLLAGGARQSLPSAQQLILQSLLAPRLQTP